MTSRMFMNRLEESTNKVETWVESHAYKGYEPFDGLSSFLLPLTFGSVFAQRLLQQLIRQCPINLRPLLGVRPLDSTKGRAYMAWGYLERYRLTGSACYKDKALGCLDWLDRNKSRLYENHAWGNHFPYASRGGPIQMDEPTVVWTSLIGQVYLEAYELFKQKRHLDIIESISKWILALESERTERGSCLSYTALGQMSVHNSNMLGAAFLAGAARHTKSAKAIQAAKEAMIYSCSRQLPDGAWFYGESPKHHWIDNFHTGYKLDSLKRYIEATGDNEFAAHLRKGFEYFKAHFFEQSGRPKYYHNRVYPIDIQCASQAIDTLTYFADYDATSLELARAVARWTIDNMQDKDGHFHYRIYPAGIRAKMPMIHWGQATTYKALAQLIHKIGK